MLEGELVCPNGCEPGGHVSLEYVDRMKARELLDFVQVADTYPELAESDPNYKPASDADIRFARRTLGMGDGTRPANYEPEEELFK